MKLIKQGTASVIPASVDFVRILPASQTPQAASAITITDSHGVDKTSAMLVSTTMDATKLSGVIEGGTVGETYVILFTCITQSYTFLQRVTLEVLDVSGTDLVVAEANAIITVADVKDFLGITTGTGSDDDFLQTWINRVSLEMEGMNGINNKIVVQDVSGEISNGTGRAKLRPLYYPIVALGVAASTSSAAKLASCQYRNDVDSSWADIEDDIDHIIWHNPNLEYANEQNSYCFELIESSFPLGTANIKISYRAGWSSVPGALTLVCLEKVAEIYRNSSKAGGGRFGIQSFTKSEGGGNLSTTYKDFTVRHQKMMRPYKRRI